jgi:hypothetical protein
MIDPENEIDLDDPEIQENIEAARPAFTTFTQVARMAGIFPREEDVLDIQNELYAKNGDIYDPVEWNFAWQRVRNQRKESARLDAELAAQEQARQRKREDYLAPSNRADTLRDLQPGQTAPSPEGFVPAREYTEAEMLAMSSDEYRRLVLGSFTTEDRQGNSGYEYKPVVRVKPGNSTKPTLRNLKKRLENL